MVVVLGNTGFLGRALERALSAREVPARGAGSSAVDLTSPSAPAQLAAVAGADATLVVLAAITPDKGINVGTLEKNLALATAVARHVEAHGAKRLVFVSSDAVYGNVDRVTESTPVELTNVYAVAKYASEEALRCVAEARSVPFLVLRPTLMFGPGDTHRSYGPNRFVFTAASEKIIKIFGDGEELRDHMFVDDFATVAAELVVGDATGVVNIATGESRSFGSVAAQLHEISGVPIERIPRKSPSVIYHRRFDVARLRELCPSFVARPFEETLRETFAAASAQGRV